MFVIGQLFIALAHLLNSVLWLYQWIVIVAVVLSWVQADPWNPIVRTIRMLTEPVFHWLRQRFPFLVMGGLDLSPLVVLFGIYFLQLYLVPVLTELGYRLK